VSAAPGIATGGLAQKTMGSVEVLAQSVAGIAPSAVMATGPALIVATAGNGAWLSYLLAMVAVVLIGLCVAQFGSRIASAGSLYSYVARSLGSGGAFTAGWGLVIGYAFIAMIGVVGVGIYGGRLLADAGLPAESTPAQVIIFAVTATAAVAFARAGIKLSTRLGLILEIISITAILILLVITVVRHGATPDSAQIQLTGSSANGITFGVVLATLGFVGFESAAALGAEAKDPHRAIPQAVLTSAVVVGVLYVFAAYVSILGLGADTLGSSGAPMDDLAKTIGLSAFRYVIDLGVAASFFAVIIASINAAARILYTMAHERILAAPLRLTHVRHRTPHIAILVLLPIILLVPAVMVIAGVTPLNVYAYTGTIGTFGYLTAYLLMAAGMPVFRQRLQAAHPYHWVLAVVTVAAVVYIVYKNLVPIPPSPYNVLPYIYLGLLAVGVAWYVAVRLHSPERARLVGTHEVGASDSTSRPEPVDAAEY